MTKRQLTVSAVILVWWDLSNSDTHVGVNSTKYLGLRISHEGVNAVVVDATKFCDLDEMAAVGEHNGAPMWVGHICGRHPLDYCAAKTQIDACDGAIYPGL